MNCFTRSSKGQFGLPDGFGTKPFKRAALKDARELLGQQLRPLGQKYSQINQCSQTIRSTLLDPQQAMVRTNNIDALVLDVSQFYAELAAMQLGMPYIHVSAALHLDYSGCTPLTLYGWPHDTTPSALARNREGVAKLVKLVQSNNAEIRAYAKSAGLQIDWDDLSSTTSPLASNYPNSQCFRL